MAEERAVVKPRTGYYDRYFRLGVAQGSLAGYKADPYAFSGTSYVQYGQNSSTSR
jgi:hypothetical protein